MIYETERLIIRKLKNEDIAPFHEMQANHNVMKYTDSAIKSYDENVIDLQQVIDYYDKVNNDFWIYAVDRKSDKEFLGTIALIKDDENNDEIGFRYLEKYWNNGYAYEALIGLINHAKKLKIKELVAAVIIKNSASAHIIKKAGFKMMKEYICKDLNLPERLYKIKL